MTPRPSLAQRLNGIRPCGCTRRTYCEPHWSALTPEQRDEHRRRVRAGELR